MGVTWQVADLPGREFFAIFAFAPIKCEENEQKAGHI